MNKHLKLLLEKWQLSINFLLTVLSTLIISIIPFIAISFHFNQAGLSNIYVVLLILIYFTILSILIIFLRVNVLTFLIKQLGFSFILYTFSFLIVTILWMETDYTLIISSIATAYAGYFLMKFG